MPLDLLLSRATSLSREGDDMNTCISILSKLEETLLEATSYDQWEELLTSYQELELRSYELQFTQEQNQYILTSQILLLVLLGEYHRAKNLYSRFHLAVPSSFFASASTRKTMEILWELVEALLQKNSSKIFDTLDQKLSATLPLPMCEKIKMVIRKRLTHQMATTFSSIRLSAAAEYLGFSSDPDACWTYIKEHGWTMSPNNIATGIENSSDEAYILPPPVKHSSAVYESTKSVFGNGGEIKAKLSTLTQMIAFLEQKRTNT